MNKQPIVPPQNISFGNALKKMSENKKSDVTDVSNNNDGFICLSGSSMDDLIKEISIRLKSFASESPNSSEFMIVLKPIGMIFNGQSSD